MIQRPLSYLDDQPTAVLSDCRRYRYMLRRGACHGAGAVNFIMLNPSVADEVYDDPTIRRCIRFAKEWGYADLIVTNLFAWRATNPADLHHVDDPIGPENDQHLIEWARKSVLVVCAWGAHGIIHGRGWIVRSALRDAGIKLFALKLTTQGQPGHPLYLKGDLCPVEWNP